MYRDFDSRRRVFACRPTAPSEEEPCARRIISRLATGADVRELGPDEVDDLVGFYTVGTEEVGVEARIQTALRRSSRAPTSSSA